MSDVLKKAIEIIHGARQVDYGHPSKNHQTTADLFNAYMRGKHPEVVLPPISAEDVCFFNILQKISRETHSKTEDNLVDIAGYIGNISIMRDYEKLKNNEES